MERIEIEPSNKAAGFRPTANRVRSPPNGNRSTRNDDDDLPATSQLTFLRFPSLPYPPNFTVLFRLPYPLSIKIGLIKGGQLCRTQPAPTKRSSLRTHVPPPPTTFPKRGSLPNVRVRGSHPWRGLYLRRYRVKRSPRTTHTEDHFHDHGNLKRTSTCICTQAARGTQPPGFGTIEGDCEFGIDDRDTDLRKRIEWQLRRRGSGPKGQRANDPRYGAGITRSSSHCHKPPPTAFHRESVTSFLL